jgi:hypothetical protein
MFRTLLVRKIAAREDCFDYGLDIMKGRVGTKYVDLVELRETA